MRSFGWRTVLEVTTPRKYILIGAPHTTNWDFPLTLLCLSALGITFNWVAKHILFRWPFGPLFAAVGGIPVDRSTGTSFVKSAIEVFNRRESFILAIAPEGTRSKVKYWKTGFYTIAEKANIPIALGFIDYPSKTVGIGRILAPSGDIERDFEIIKQFYHDKIGKFPEKQGEIRFKRKKSHDRAETRQGS